MCVSYITIYYPYLYEYRLVVALPLPVTFNRGDGSGVQPNKAVGSLPRVTSLLFQLIRLRDNYLVLSGDFNINHSDFLTLNNYVSSVEVSDEYSHVCIYMYYCTNFIMNNSNSA